jgi:hypothetical protein
MMRGFSGFSGSAGATSFVFGFCPALMNTLVGSGGRFDMGSAGGGRRAAGNETESDAESAECVGVADGRRGIAGRVAE